MHDLKVSRQWCCTCALSRHAQVLGAAPCPLGHSLVSRGGDTARLLGFCFALCRSHENRALHKVEFEKHLTVLVMGRVSAADLQTACHARVIGLAVIGRTVLLKCFLVWSVTSALTYRTGSV